MLVGILGTVGCGGKPPYPNPRPARKPKVKAANDAVQAGVPAPQPSTAPQSTDGGGSGQPSGIISPATAPNATGTPRSSTVFVPADSEALKLVIEPLSPAQSLPAVEVRRLAVMRLRKIAAAIAAYAADNGSYPPAAYRDGEGAPTLSWRVRLLPYLGHKDLYARFKLAEPFNSPNNRVLISEIPPVYQSPSRPDAKTNFQLIACAGSMFPPGAVAGTPLSAVQDGFKESAVVVEVDNGMAADWTAPVDYLPAAADPMVGLREMHNDGFLLGWADGSVSMWPRSAPENLVAGLFSIAGNEPPARSLSVAALPVDSGDASRVGTSAPIGKPVRGADSATDATSPVNPAPSPTMPPTVPPTIPPANARPSGSVGSNNAVDIRREPPSEEQLAEASSIVRDLYDREFKNAKLDKDKRDFAKKLIEDVERIEADSAGRFVLLRAARDIAAKAGDVTVAIDACDRLGREFRVDLLSMKLKVLEQAVVNLAADTELAPLYDNSLKLGDEALKLDDFKAAQSLYRLAMNAARRGRSAEREYQINLRESDLRETRVAYQRITDHVHTLVRAPEDPTANAAVGRYYLLLKRDWERGLPMVARGDNALLRKLAEADLAQPTNAEAMVAVGDQWWDFAEKLSVDTEKTSGRIRSLHWYEAALPMLGASLQKIRVEKRVAEIKREVEKAEGKQLPGGAASRRS
jgi:hypothetical protein